MDPRSTGAMDQASAGRARARERPEGEVVRFLLSIPIYPLSHLIMAR